MTFDENVPLNQPGELNPWVICTPSAHDESVSQLVVWGLSSGASTSAGPSAEKGIEIFQNLTEGANQQETALALFSDRQTAEDYARQYCSLSNQPPRIEQFGSRQLVSVLAECYRQGMRYAALNPGATSAHQIFVLRDVLAAAKKQLREHGKL